MIKLELDGFNLAASVSDYLMLHVALKEDRVVMLIGDERAAMEGSGRQDNQSRDFRISLNKIWRPAGS